LKELKQMIKLNSVENPDKHLLETDFVEEFYNQTLEELI
jgi:hypothetical protein